MPALEIRGLTVAVGRRRILRDISLSIGAGEVHVLMGPNGSGKTTLLNALMGLPGSSVKAGEILVGGEKINSLSIDERVRAGMALAFQRPPPVRGVTLGVLTSKILDRSRRGEVRRRLAAAVAMEAFLDREVNVGLSGGETKRSEMLQMLALDPRVALFDEPESGVDLDNISVVGKAMRSILGIGTGGEGKAGLIVTHTGHILSQVPARKAHVLLGGRIVCSGRPADLFGDVRKHGYEGCLQCRKCLGS